MREWGQKQGIRENLENVERSERPKKIEKIRREVRDGRKWRTGGEKLEIQEI